MSSLLQLSDLACQAEPIKPLTIDENSKFSNVASRNVGERGVGITEEDREIIRNKMRMAYKKKCSTFFELLELCVSVDEEFTYNNAPSKLDYYKNGIQNVKRIFEKKTELENGALEAKSGSSSEEGDENPKGTKRVKTQS